MRVGPPIRALLATAVLVLPLAALARAPFTPQRAGASMLRFSWRLAAPAAERCRPRTPEEMATLPAHMRTPEVCERDVARYTLIVRTGDEPADTLALQGAGVKGDRPLFVLEERVVPPGRRRIEVQLWREAGPGSRERVTFLDTVVAMEPARVRLVTLEEGRLRVR